MKKNISHSISMLNLSLNQLRLVSKSRSIKGYKNMSKERLLSALSEPELVDSFDDEKLKKIRKVFNELRNTFSKPQAKEISENLCGKKIFQHKK